MSRFWSEVVHGLVPYVPGEQPKQAGLVKLNTNESPYGPSPHALAAMREAATDALRLYPDPNADALKAALAATHGLRPEQVFVGNGSDEVLAHVFMALLKHERPLLFPDITYSFYPVYCGLYGVRFETVPLTDALTIDPAAYRPGCGAIILANPNAPTGAALPRAAIAALLGAHPDVPVVIDEAYVDFGAESAMTLIDEHPNLLVVQTMSKSRGLAGLRIGYALGDTALIAGLERVKNSFNSYPLGRIAQAGAVAALQDAAYFETTRRTIIAERERLAAALRERGFVMPASSANFLFARHPAHRGADLAAALRARNVLVRHFRLDRISDHLRITIGTAAQTDRLVEAMDGILVDRATLARP